MSRTCVLAVLGLLFSVRTDAADLGSFAASLESIRTADLQKHVTVLASDTFEGREAGSQGGQASSVYLAKELKRLDIASGVSPHTYFQEFGDGYRNVIALIPGNDAELKKQYILAGAHFDHVGYGNRANSRGPIGYIHNGADDNASGTSGMLEVIEAFALLNPPPKRSLLFVFWDAEEKGLLGSKHWVANPTVELDAVRFSVNADMIGRAREQRVEVHGARSGFGLRQFLSERNQGLDLRLDFTWRMMPESDHYPFFERSIPSVMIHTGKHEDYHRPSDDLDKLNGDGMQQVSRLLFRLLWDAADQPVLPAFREQSRNENELVQQHAESPLPPLPTRLGVAWDQELERQHIVQLTQVVQGSPAHKAGLQVGDRIERFGGYDVSQADDFRTVVLTSFNSVSATVKRDGQEQPIELTVQLNGDPIRVGIAWQFDNAEPNNVVVRRVIPGSPSDRGGLRANDRISEVSGHPPSTNEEFQRLMNSLESPLRFVIEREGLIQPVVVELLSQPTEGKK